MKKLYFLSLCLLIFCFAFQSQAQEVSGVLETKIVRKGASGKGKIILELPKDVHVNSSKPKTEYAVPLKLTLTAPQLKFAKIKYPKGFDKKFDFSETPINVYENRVEFPFSFFVPKKFRRKNAVITARFLYQACTTEVCYEPQTEIIKMPVKVKP